MLLLITVISKSIDFLSDYSEKKIKYQKKVCQDSLFNFCCARSFVFFAFFTLFQMTEATTVDISHLPSLRNNRMSTTQTREGTDPNSPKAVRERNLYSESMAVNAQFALNVFFKQEECFKKGQHLKNAMYFQIKSRYLKKGQYRNGHQFAFLENFEQLNTRLVELKRQGIRPCWNELIKKNHRCKPYIDFDLKREFLAKDVNSRQLLEAVLETYNAVVAEYDLPKTTLDQCAITDASGEKKISFHLVLLTHYYPNNAVLGRVMKIFNDQLPDILKFPDNQGVDQAVYTSNRVMRGLDIYKRDDSGEPVRPLVRWAEGNAELRDIDFSITAFDPDPEVTADPEKSNLPIINLPTIEETVIPNYDKQRKVYSSTGQPAPDTMWLMNLLQEQKIEITKVSKSGETSYRCESVFPRHCCFLSNPEDQHDSNNYKIFETPNGLYLRCMSARCSDKDKYKLLKSYKQNVINAEEKREEQERQLKRLELLKIQFHEDFKDLNNEQELPIKTVIDWWKKWMMKSKPSPSLTTINKFFHEVLVKYLNNYWVRIVEDSIILIKLPQGPERYKWHRKTEDKFEKHSPHFFLHGIVNSSGNKILVTKAWVTSENHRHYNSVVSRTPWVRKEHQPHSDEFNEFAGLLISHEKAREKGDANSPLAKKYKEFFYDGLLELETNPAVKDFAWVQMCAQYQRAGWQTKCIVVLFSIVNQVGKGNLIVVHQKLSGENLVVSSDQKNLIGPFNKLLNGKLLVLVDEYENNPDDFQTLKRNCTNPTVTINPKGVDATSVPNTTNTFLTTNNIEQFNSREMDQRVLMLTIGDGIRATDNDGKLKWQDLIDIQAPNADPEKQQQFYYDLALMFLNEEKVKLLDSGLRIPETIGQKQQAIDNEEFNKPVVSWWRSILSEHGKTFPFGQFVPSSYLFHLFQKFDTEHHLSSTKMGTEFSNCFVKKPEKKKIKKNSTEISQRVRDLMDQVEIEWEGTQNCWLIPSVEECRKQFKMTGGTSIDVVDEEEKQLA